MFDDWMDKYALIIDHGNLLKPLDEKHRLLRILLRDVKVVCGCTHSTDGKLHFSAESDAVIERVCWF